MTQTAKLCDRKWFKPDEMMAKYRCMKTATHICEDNNGNILTLCTYHATKWRMWRNRKKQGFQCEPIGEVSKL